MVSGQAHSKLLKVSQMESGCGSSGNCSMENEIGTSKQSDGETSISNTNMGASPENNTDVSSMQRNDVELRYANEPTGNHDDCSTSCSQQVESSRVLLRNRSHGTGERNKRKRWKGRHDDMIYNPDISLGGSSKQEPSFSTTVTSTTNMKMSKEQQVFSCKFLLPM